MLLAGYGIAAGQWSWNMVSMLILLSQAISCLGALEVRIHRRMRFKQQQTASTLASALRNGALR
jgi:hypothetical protein